MEARSPPLSPAVPKVRSGRRGGAGRTGAGRGRPAPPAPEGGGRGAGDHPALAQKPPAVRLCVGSRKTVPPLLAKFCLTRHLEATRKTFKTLVRLLLPRRAVSGWSVPGPSSGHPLRLPAPCEGGGAPTPESWSGGGARSGLRGKRGLPRPLPRGSMDYLTTFTGKSGRLLRGTAGRLWGLGGGGEARQVRFEDSLREPAQGDPGCGSSTPRPPAASRPDGPGEPGLPSPPARPTWAEGWGRRRAGRVARPGVGAAGASGKDASCPEDGALSAVCAVALPSCSALPAFFT